LGTIHSLPRGGGDQREKPAAQGNQRNGKKKTGPQKNLGKRTTTGGKIETKEFKETEGGCLPADKGEGVTGKTKRFLSN